MSGLRAELMGATGTVVPPYRMLLPPGWQAYDLEESTERELLGRADARLRGVGNTALGPALAGQVHEVLDRLRARNGFAYALAGEAAPSWALGMASLIGVKRIATPEATLDQIVQNAIQRHQAVPIGEGHRIVRWTERRIATVDGEDAATMLVNYLIPIPGTRRTQAVQWTATVSYDEDMPADHPDLALWVLLFDTHVSTFTWMDA